MADRRGTRCICIPVLCPARCTETVYRVAHLGTVRSGTITIATEAGRAETVNPEPNRNLFYDAAGCICEGTVIRVEEMASLRFVRG